MVSPLGENDLQRFVADGFVRLDGAFTRTQAEVASSVLFEQAGIDLTDPATWTEPVVRIAGSSDEAVIETISTDRLTGAIDQLVGASNWLPRTTGFGTFPVRFPSPLDPGDAGWHIDGSFGDPPSYKVNFASQGRALLLLMLYTDVSPEDAPTRIRVGSHLDVARALARIEGDVTFVPERHAPSVLDFPIQHAIGSAGTVYLCHPFLVHAATWPHEGSSPRLVAQPCIHHPEGEWLGGFDYDNDGDVPVVRAVRLALATD